MSGPDDISSRISFQCVGRMADWHEGNGKPGTLGDDRYWMGSLAVGMRDAMGQMYMRNRYYDPQTGQFTQPDSIGLAGGLNSYGFAAGDPGKLFGSVWVEGLLQGLNQRGGSAEVPLYDLRGRRVGVRTLPTEQQGQIVESCFAGGRGSADACIVSAFQPRR
jgi:hypothetical protein